MFDLDYELFKIYKPKADKVIERVKIEKRKFAYVSINEI